MTGTTLATTAESFTFTGYGELDTATATVSGSPVCTYDTTRDAGGRIVSKEETIGGVTSTWGYRYDAAGRLDQVTKDGVVVETYAYDANSNRTSWTDFWGSATATYDDQDRMLTAAGASYTYSANGELQQKVAGPETTTFGHDVFSNLRTVTLPTGIAIEYVIDASHRRVGKKVNGTLVKGWLWESALRPAAEIDGAGGVVSEFVYGTKANVPDYVVKSGATYRLFTDHLGSVRLVVDATTGAIAQRLDYDAFGRVMQDTNPGFQPFGFAGGLYDHQTGLTRFGARDYDATTGRWTSKDPIGFAGGDTNLYGYVVSDPIGGFDPLGLYDGADFLQDLGDFSAGFGDTLSFGATRAIRRLMGVDHVVDRCSGFYSGGGVSGTALSLAFGSAHLGRNALYQAGRSGVTKGLGRLAWDARSWSSVRRTWSTAAGNGGPFLLRAGQQLHHWLMPQRAGAVQGLTNAGFNYLPLSAGFNSWMNGSTATRVAAEWGLKGTIGGIYGGLSGPAEADGCECSN